MSQLLKGDYCFSQEGNSKVNNTVVLKPPSVQLYEIF